MSKPSRTRKVNDFVVYVYFPSGHKEYVYKCDLPNITVGSRVVANGTEVMVHRIAAFDSLATRYVSSPRQAHIAERKRQLVTRLEALERAELALARWSKLKSPEAKKLVAELKELANDSTR